MNASMARACMVIRKMSMGSAKCLLRVSDALWRHVLNKRKNLPIKSFLCCFLTLTASLATAEPLLNETKKPPGYAVATANPLATNAGLKILAQGGNAFDAAVAVSAVLAVVEPYHSGLGGGGFWLLYRAHDGKTTVIDSRETAPLAAQANMYLDSKGQRNPLLSLNGGLAAAIPGEPAGLCFIATHYGRLPLATSLAPAIELAERGFPIDAQLQAFLSTPDRLKLLQSFPETARIFLNNGKPRQLGEILKQPELAFTLKQIAAKGRAGFYEGIIAERLVKGVNAAGGIWQLADLQRYTIKERPPLIDNFGNMRVITIPPPSAGGVELLSMLHILAGLPIQESCFTAQCIHNLIEAMRLSYWQANKTLADPDFVPIDLPFLLSEKNAATLRQLITDKAKPSAELTESNAFRQQGQTTHISILDRDGNRVAATLTINFIFGSGVIPSGTGVLLNDEMDDFSTKPGERNVFGLVGSTLNTIAPGKRPLSNMTPLFLEMPQRLAIAGTPGGSRIPTMMLLAALTFKNYGGAISMVAAMRFHHQYLPDWIQFEPDTFSPALQQQLKAMGYKLMALKQYYGDMQAITWDQQTNVITAASDPRHIGLAIAVNDKPLPYKF